MPVYTFDNHSRSLEKAEKCVRDVLGSNCITVESITAENATRISVETAEAIHPNKVYDALNKLEKAVAENPANETPLPPAAVTPATNFPPVGTTPQTKPVDNTVAAVADASSASVVAANQAKVEQAKATAPVIPNRATASTPVVPAAVPNRATAPVATAPTPVATPVHAPIATAPTPVSPPSTQETKPAGVTVNPAVSNKPPGV